MLTLPWQRLRRVCLKTSAVSLACLALAATAQQTNSTPPPNSGQPSQSVQLVPRTPEQRERQSHESHIVVLNVEVTGPDQTPVTGLTENDFTLLDNSQPQKIVFFRESSAAVPVHIVFVFDAVNDRAHDLNVERQAVEKFLRRSPSPLAFPIAIAQLSDAGLDTSSESTNAVTLLAQAGNAALGIHARPTTVTAPDLPEGGAGAVGGTMLPPDMRTRKLDLGWSDRNQRFLLSLNGLTELIRRENQVSGRILVVWLGPGWPSLTGPGFKADTEALRSNYFDHIADFTNNLRDAQITLDMIALPDKQRDATPDLTPVTAPAQASAAHLALPILALDSGGQVFDTNPDIASAIAACLADARSWYTLSFVSAPSGAPDEYRPLKVTGNRPGVSVRTSTGYYAEP